MSEWGQRHGQGRIAHEELDPTLLMWGMRRQIDAARTARRATIVLRLEFRGLPQAHAARRYWWMILRPDDVEVCLKDPGAEVDVVLDRRPGGLRARLDGPSRPGRRAGRRRHRAVRPARQGAPNSSASLRLTDAPGAQGHAFSPAA